MGDFLIRLSKSKIGSLEKEYVLKVLDSEYLGMGPEVGLFENEISSLLGRRAVCVNTGTSALHLALQALGVTSGDEVLVPSLTYVASYQAISATGAVPVSIDVDSRSLLMCPEDAKKKITNKTKVILTVFYASQTDNIDDIYALANEKKLRVVEDAAHCFGSFHEGKRVGSFGDVTCFSFDGIKNITSGEGGCIVSSDEIFLDKVSDLRLLGISGDSERRYLKSRTWNFNIREQGWRYHMSDIMAAIGRAQLTRLDEFSNKRRALAHSYVSKLGNSSLIKLLRNDFEGIAPHIFVVRVKNRDLVKDRLSAKGIQVGIHYVPNHFHELYRSSEPLKNTEEAFLELLSLPLHCDLEEEDIDYITKSIIEVVNEL